MTIQTEPAAEPVSTDDAKLHLRVDIDDDDDLIDALVKAAREHVEIITRRALITQTWDYYLDEFPTGSVIEIPRPPLQSVTHVKYTDKDGTESTFSSASYHVDTDGEPGRIVLKYGESWPGDTLQTSNPIVVRFVAGYGESGASVPEAIIQAIKLLVGHYYENREAVYGGRGQAMMLPSGVDALLWGYRVLRFL